MLMCPSTGIEAERLLVIHRCDMIRADSYRELTLGTKTQAVQCFKARGQEATLLLAEGGQSGSLLVRGVQRHHSLLSPI